MRIIATVSGNTSAITKYAWTFDTGATPATAETTGNTVTVRWATVGTKLITVTVSQADGPSADGFGTVTITAGGGAVAPVKK